jgi:hypothetical protein
MSNVSPLHFTHQKITRVNAQRHDRQSRILTRVGRKPSRIQYEQVLNVMGLLKLVQEGGLLDFYPYEQLPPRAEYLRAELAGIGVQYSSPQRPRAYRPLN